MEVLGTREGLGDQWCNRLASISQPGWGRKWLRGRYVLSATYLMYVSLWNLGCETGAIEQRRKGCEERSFCLNKRCGMLSRFFTLNIRLCKKLETLLPQATPRPSRMYQETVAQYMNSQGNQLIVDVGGGATMPVCET
jgi:hypothetical protein